MKLESISTEELSKELDKRRAEQKRKFEAEREKAYQSRIVRFSRLTKEMIDVFVPVHARTSCQDDNLESIYSFDLDRRCLRCALIELVDNEYLLPLDIDLEVRFKIV